MLFKNIKNMHVALAFLFGILTTFIVLYAIQVNKSKRIKKENDALLTELKDVPSQENYDRLFNAFYKCAVETQNGWGILLYSP